MKRRTFQAWLRRYAQACVELSWIGGKYDGIEYDEVKRELIIERNKAMKKIMALHTRWIA